MDFAKEILPVNIEDELKQSYLSYAMSVIHGRALPDVRDGLKPVHRRILYAMHDLKNNYNKPYKKSARVVGWAMNASHQNSDIPAHRVVNRVGLLTGKHHFSGTNLMQNLLESEGVKIQNDRVLNFKKVVWDPSKELN